MKVVYNKREVVDAINNKSVVWVSEVEWSRVSGERRTHIDQTNVNDQHLGASVCSLAVN